jgi:hypothetical protein
MGGHINIGPITFYGENAILGGEYPNKTVGLYLF